MSSESTHNPPPTTHHSEREPSVLVLDFGAQYAQLIARRVREGHVRSEIVSRDIGPEEIRAHNPVGLILSGGPASVYAEGAYRMDPAILEMGIPVLGICYGHQLIADLAGGTVVNTGSAEYGNTDLVRDRRLGPAQRSAQGAAGLDVPSGPGHRGPGRVRRRSHLRWGAGGSDGGSRPRSLRCPVPPRSGAHATRG